MPGISPCCLDIADLGAPVISAFLDHLEPERNNSIRTRNARLAAIHFPVRLRGLTPATLEALRQK
jgi:integrase/recombinase XerD